MDAVGEQQVIRTRFVCRNHYAFVDVNGGGCAQCAAFRRMTKAQRRNAAAKTEEMA